MGANKKSNFQKCGNILIDINTLKSQIKTCVITCGFCDAEYDQMEIFSQHLEEKHSHHFDTVGLDPVTEPENNSSLTIEQEASKIDDQPVVNVAEIEKMRSSFNPNEGYEHPLGSGPSHETRNAEEIIVTPLKREYDDSYDDDDEYWDPQRNKRFNNTSRDYSEDEMDAIQKTNYYANVKEYPSKESISGNSKNDNGELPSTRMPYDHGQPFQGRMKCYSQQANPKCHCCKEFSKKFDSYTDTAQKQYNNLVDILAQHKVLLDRIVTQNAVGTTNSVCMFPINSEEQLREFDAILATQADPYVRQIKTLLDGNAERNLHQIFGYNIIMNFNVDGTRGKKRIRDFTNVFAAMMDVISTFSESSDKTLRAAFQRQKRKYFKQTSRSKAKNQDQQSRNESDSSDKEDLAWPAF